MNDYESLCESITFLPQMQEEEGTVFVFLQQGSFMLFNVQAVITHHLRISAEGPTCCRYEASLQFSCCRVTFCRDKQKLAEPSGATAAAEAVL